MRGQRAQPAQAPRLVPAEQRIRGVADALFREFGVRVVSIRMIAENADTNETTVVKYYRSKDRLILRYLEPLVKAAREYWTEVLAEPPEQPLEKLRGHLEVSQDMALDRRAGRDELARVSAELAEVHTLSWHFLRKYWQSERDQIAKLCEQAGCREPKALADKLFMLVEGARIGAECIGHDGPAAQLVDAGNTLIRAHLP